MDVDRSKEAEIDRNFAAFTLLLPSLMRDHGRQYALLRDGAVIGFHATALDAQIAGNQAFEDGLFSIQQVEQPQGRLRRGVGPMRQGAAG